MGVSSDPARSVEVSPSVICCQNLSLTSEPKYTRIKHPEEDTYWTATGVEPKKDVRARNLSDANLTKLTQITS